jgi:rhamnosyl/mannosyltransferase
VGTLGLLASNPVCVGMIAAIRKAPADIVHLHHPNPTAFLAYLLSRHTGRLVVTYHSDIVRQKWLARAFGPLLRSVLRRSSAIIVSSPDLAASSPVLAKFRQNCHVIPFGIAAEKFGQVDTSAVEEIRKRYRPPIVLGVGRLVYYKGFEHLIRAMKNVQARLLLIGAGPLRPELEYQVQELGLRDRVHFLGMVPSLNIYYHAADVFVLPSVASSEAFGIVQLEAMACGKPVVNTTLNSGVPFVSLDGVTGLSVTPADPVALANAISLLLDNRVLNSQYGTAARKRVVREFSLELMVSRTVQLYDDVVNIAREPAEIFPEQVTAPGF